MLDSGKTNYDFKNISQQRIRKDLTNFVENDMYVIMYSSNEIDIYPKGSEYRTIKGSFYNNKKEKMMILGKNSLHLLEVCEKRQKKYSN